MRPGARSIRGAMGAYAAAGALVVGVLALVLWWGGPQVAHCRVELPADSAWESAALDDGRTLRTLQRGGQIEAPPGHYRLTLMHADGTSEQRTLQVETPLTTL